jgi:hypothetical protein
MEMSRMLEVINIRFKGLRPTTRKVSDEKFIIEVDNLSKTSRIAIRGIVGLDNVPKYHSVDATLENGRIEQVNESDRVIVEEIQKAVIQALV